METSRQSGHDFDFLWQITENKKALNDNRKDERIIWQKSQKWWEVDLSKKLVKMIQLHICLYLKTPCINLK